MFCPKCGTAFADGTRKCENCGYELLEETSKERNDLNQQPKEDRIENPIAKSYTPKKLSINIIFYVLAALVLIISLYAAHCVISGGMEIGSIESVGGQTLEEAYYQSLGTVFAGYAAMIRATGIFFASILAYIGFKN